MRATNKSAIEVFFAPGEWERGLLNMLYANQSAIWNDIRNL